MIRTAACIGALALAPGWAAAWTATNDHKVTPLPDGSFEVIGRSGSSNVNYWCAAGDYARRVLKAPQDQRIYITRGRDRAQTADRKSAVQFSLELPVRADTRPRFLLSVTRVGENLSVFSAWTYCLEHKSDQYSPE